MEIKVLNEKLKNLETQKIQLEQTYSKVQGAIEFCNSLIKEIENPKEEDKNDKSKSK